MSPPTVCCYRPKSCKDSKEVIDLEYLDTGIYYFDIDFNCQGNHLLVYFEGEQKTGILNAIVRPY